MLEPIIQKRDGTTLVKITGEEFDIHMTFDIDGIGVGKLTRKTVKKERTARKRRGCGGCGGSKYDPTDYNKPGGSDELIQQLD